MHGLGAGWGDIARGEGAGRKNWGPRLQLKASGGRRGGDAGCRHLAAYSAWRGWREKEKERRKRATCPPKPTSRQLAGLRAHGSFRVPGRSTREWSRGSFIS